MGYESKLYICKRVKIDDLVWNETLAAINMCVMDMGFRALFTNKLNGDFYGMDGAMSHFEPRVDENEPELVDNYDDELLYTSLDEVRDWCSDYMSKATKEEDLYWRIPVLNDMLCSIKAWIKLMNNEKLIVVHYGY